MAVDLCSDNSSLNMSPRYSFSHDLSQPENIDPPLDSLTSSDFDFNIRQSLDHDSSSADELFSDGMIRSVQIKKKVVKSKQKDHHRSNSRSIPQPPSPPPPPPNVHDRDSKTIETIETENQKQNTKSFWTFKRSSSLNCGSGYARSLCPIPLLSRSNSAGSASSEQHKRNQRQNSQKQSPFASMKSNQGSLSNYQKPPLKKSSAYGSYGNTNSGIHVNPLIHVPSASLFGLGSIFSNGKVKNKAR